MEHAALLAFVMLLPVMASPGACFAADEPPSGTGRLDYFGYADCIKLENDNCRVVLCLHGGRVLEYAWKGQNALYLDPAQKGWTHEAGKPAVDPCGGRFDIGPEHTIPRHPALWLGKWTAEVTGPRAARLTSVEDQATGVQLVREFKLDRASSKLSCTQIVKNISSEPKPWCHWSRTLAKGGGICLVPLTPQSRFPKNYLMYGPGSVLNFLPEDDNIRTRGGFLEVLGTPKEPKLGFDSSAGWLCYLTSDNLMFVKRYPVYPDRVYNEIAGLTLALWYFKNEMCELEPTGPMGPIAAGESASFTELWWLLPYEFPAQRDKVDLEDVTQIVLRHAR